MSLAEIITTSIQAGTVNPARRGFGIPLFLTVHDAWADPNEVRSYTAFSGVAADFDPADLAYQWAAAVFAQNPRPERIKIAKLPTPASAHTLKIDASGLVSGTAIALAVTEADGTEHAVSVAWNTDVATTLGALKTVLDAIPSIGTCTVGSGVITVPAASNGQINMIESSTANVNVRDSTLDWDYDDALDDVLNADPLFYFVHTDVCSPKNVDKVARWCSANDRHHFAHLQYDNPADFASGEFTSGSDLTALQANDDWTGLMSKTPRAAFTDARWVGRMAPLDPGSATWAFKTLSGASSDAYSASQRAAIEGAHANHYTEEASVAITRPGKAGGGEWTDVVIGLAWLEATLQETLFAALINSPKIPYTSEGFAVLVNETRGVLRIAEQRGIIDSGWTVTILPVAEQSALDRAARIVRGLEFEARLAGAVHQVILVGTVTA